MTHIKNFREFLNESAENVSDKRNFMIKSNSLYRKWGATGDIKVIKFDKTSVDNFMSIGNYEEFVDGFILINDKLDKIFYAIVKQDNQYMLISKYDEDYVIWIEKEDILKNVIKDIYDGFKKAFKILKNIDHTNL